MGLEEAHCCGYWVSPSQSLSCLLFLCITEYKRLGEESCCRRLSFFLFAGNPPVLLEQGFRVFELSSRGRRLLSINLLILLFWFWTTTFWNFGGLS